MNLDAIAIGHNPPEDVNTIIEVPIGGEPIKYEMDKAAGTLVVDRFLYTPMRYPGNYGFVPHTLSDDGDPIDVLVANTRPIVPGAVMNVRPIGVLRMEDDGGGDEKIIAVPSSRITQRYVHVKTYTDLPEITRQQIEHFFVHYKDLEPGKWVKLHGLGRCRRGAPPDRRGDRSREEARNSACDQRWPGRWPQQTTHQFVAHVMRPLKQEDRMLSIGGELGAKLVQRGGAEAAADLRPESFGDDAQAILAQPIGKDIGVAAGDRRLACVDADTILEEDIEIGWKPARQPVGQGLGPDIGAVIDADPERTRQAPERVRQPRGLGPGGIDLDREVPTGHFERRRQAGEATGNIGKLRHLRARDAFVVTPRQTEDDFLRPWLLRDALPVGQLRHQLEVGARHEGEAVDHGPLDEKSPHTEPVPVAARFHRRCVGLPTIPSIFGGAVRSCACVQPLGAASAPSMAAAPAMAVRRRRNGTIG